MTVVLDTGAFLEIERGNRHLLATLKSEIVGGRPPVTHGGVVAQMWRGGSGRQSEVARLLGATRVVALDEELGRRAGMLLAKSGMSDAIDAGVVCLARPGDRIITSDSPDMRRLVESAGISVRLTQL